MPVSFLFHSDLLRITRFGNLLIIGLCQYFVVGFLMDRTLLTDWHLLALASSTAFIAAAGYIINDYYDVKIDLINKPDRVVIGKTLPRRSALLLHSFLSLAGIGIGFLLHWQIGVVNFSSAFILWWYSNTLKRLPFAGNFTVALLTSLAVVIVLLLYPSFSKTTILIYALFAFYMTLVREIIKDMEDWRGDQTFGCRTLPIIWGPRKTKNLIFLLTAAFGLNLVLIHLLIESLPILYFTFFLFLPTALLVIRLLKADTTRDFYQLSGLCKAIMLFGILSMAFL